MAESMTGFGRGSASSQAGTVTVEIKTVNSRFLELNFKCDAGAAAEDLVRRLIKDSIARGKAYISINFAPAGESGVHASFNQDMLEAQAAVLKEAPSPRISPSGFISSERSLLF